MPTWPRRKLRGRRRVEAAKGVALIEAELQKEVECMNALTRIEKLKADLLSQANVEYETKVS